MLSTYGWSPALQRDFISFAAQGLTPARVIVQQRGHYRVITEDGETEGRISGRLAHDAREGGYPVVGDWLAVEKTDSLALIQAVLPRRTAFTRRAAGPGGGLQVVAANADIALLVTSLNEELNPRRLERYLATAYESGAAPVVVLTKADAGADVPGLVAEAEAVAFGAPVIAVSAATGDGLQALAAHLGPGSTAVLLGSSGVGKSTLVNALAGADLMTTQAIREDDAHGRHTTTHRELILLPSGALILDTPGMRELGLWDAEAGVAAAFAGLSGEVERIAQGCRFRDCAHDREPGCAVREALADGTLDAGRWRGFQKLQRELAREARRQDPIAREAERRRWIGLHKAGREKGRAKTMHLDD